MMFGKGQRPVQAALSAYGDFSRTRETRQAIEAVVGGFSDHRVDDIGEFFRDDFRWTGNFGCGSKCGLREFQDNCQRPFRAAFSEKVRIDEARLFTGEWAAAFGREEAVHSGEIFGIKPNGKRVEIRFMDFWKVIDGKIADNRLIAGFPRALSRLGLDVLEGRGREAIDRGETASSRPGSESGADE